MNIFDFLRRKKQESTTEVSKDENSQDKGYII